MSNMSHRSRIARRVEALLKISHSEALRRADAAALAGALPASLADLDAAVAAVLAHRSRRTKQPLSTLSPLLVGSRAHGDGSVSIDASSHRDGSLVFVVGDPGSGKTALALSMALQAQEDRKVVVLNVKGFDSLASVAALADGHVIRTSSSKIRPFDPVGAFDPFRFASTPALAAKIATGFLLAALPDLGEQAQLEFIAATDRALRDGAACVGELISEVDFDIQLRIQSLMEEFPLFAACIGVEPKPRLDLTSSFTLLEIDRKLELPDPSHRGAPTSSQRVSLAVVRLLAQASLELLAASGGGMFVMDEAWLLLGHHGEVFLEEFRTGRWKNVTPVLTVQPGLLPVPTATVARHANHLFVLQHRHPASDEALSLAGQPAASRAALSGFGPRRARAGEPARGARGWYRPRGQQSVLLDLVPLSSESELLGALSPWGAQLVPSGSSSKPVISSKRPWI